MTNPQSLSDTVRSLPISKDLGLMLDFETLGTNVASCALLEVTAVLFGLPSEDSVEYTFDIPLFPHRDVFFCTFDLRDQITHGRYIEPDSVGWWVKFPHFESMIRRSLDREINQDIPTFLQQFSLFYRLRCRDIGAQIPIYAKGTNFDISILEAMFRAQGLESCWKYNNVVDVRSVCKAADVKAIHAPDALAHDSFADCLFQIESVRRATYIIRTNDKSGAFPNAMEVESHFLAVYEDAKHVRDTRVTRYLVADGSEVRIFGREPAITELRIVDRHPNTTQSAKE